MRKDGWLWILKKDVFGGCQHLFKKKDKHRVTYKSGGKSTQVDYVMCTNQPVQQQKIVCHNPRKNMSIDAHEIIFTCNHSLKNWEKYGHRRHLNLFTKKKDGEQSNFSGIIYVIRGLKWTCKNVSQKNESYFASNTSDSILQLFFFVVKLIVSTHNTSKLIFRHQKDFGYRLHNKVNVFCSVIFVTLGFFDKIVQNHDTGKTVLLFFSQFLDLLCLWSRSKSHVVSLYTCKNEHKKYFIKFMIEPNMNRKSH